MICFKSKSQMYNDHICNAKEKKNIVLLIIFKRKSDPQKKCLSIFQMKQKNEDN